MEGVRGPMLALDTSGAVSVALHDGTSVVAHRHRYDPRRHSELLMPFVDEVLREAGTDRHDLQVVAVGTGPGPFTGLRVGLVTARTLALTLGLTVHGVPSLDAVAAEVVERGLVPDGADLAVATDARRREIYWGGYRNDAGEAVRRTGPAVERPADVDPGGRAWFGRGAVLYADVLLTDAHRETAEQGPLDASAATLARVAVRRIASGAAGPDAPLYLRRPDAVEPAARKRVGT